MANELENRAKKAPRPRKDKRPAAAGKDAESPSGERENSIRPSRRKVRAAPEGQAARETSPSPSAAAPSAQSRGRAMPSQPRVIPEHIHRRFVAVGHRYYFADGAHAFTDRGSRLTTPSENTEVIKSLITIAEARGWTEITVSGTARFRKEAWAAASIAGLTVRGFQPAELERAQLARTIGRESGRAQASATAAPQAPERPPTAPGATPLRDRYITGRLIEQGPAPYRHDPHERMSYFVKIDTPTGIREIWGVDLQRALKESLTKPTVGDEVGLRATRREAVKVPVAQRDADGALVREAPLETHRNHWILEKREFFAERAAAAHLVRDAGVDPKEAARRHPELVGTFLQMRAAELAVKQFREPADRATFLARVRSALADAIARGEPLSPVRLRDRPPPARSTPAPADLAR